MNRNPVTSSQIASIGYDPSTNTLEVEFRKGGVYQYSNVSQSDHTDLITAASIGSHFYRHIKPNPAKFPYKKV